MEIKKLAEVSKRNNYFIGHKMLSSKGVNTPISKQSTGNPTLTPSHDGKFSTTTTPNYNLSVNQPQAMYSSFSGTGKISQRSSKPEYDSFFKVLLIGPANSGKTSIIRQYCSQQFDDRYQSTFGMKNHLKSISHSQATVRLSIWDTPSDPRFCHQIDFHISNADAVLFVYDGEDSGSFPKLEALLQEYSNSDNCNKASLFLISNKKEKRSKDDQQSSLLKETILKYNLPFINTSARSSRLIDELFEQVVDAMLQKENTKNEELARENDLLYLMRTELGTTIEEALSKQKDHKEKDIKVTELPAEKKRKYIFTKSLNTSAISVKLNSKALRDCLHPKEFKLEKTSDQFLNEIVYDTPRKALSFENESNEEEDDSISEFAPFKKQVKVYSNPSRGACCSSFQCIIF